MKRVVLGVMLIVSLTACDGGPTGSGAPAPAVAHDAMEARIDALSPSLQRTTMFRAIQDGGYTCQKIVRLEKHTPRGGKPTWIAICDDRGQYVVELQPGGIFWVSGVPQPKRP